MTTFTPPADTPGSVPSSAARAPRPCRWACVAPARLHRARAFTLTEVIVASALSAFILAGVLSTFLLLGKTGLNASAYAEMNSRLRVALERFDRDVRLAADLHWHDERRLTLVLPGAPEPEVTYAFEPAANPAAPGRFVRQAGAAAPEVLVNSVAPDFSFRRYRLPTELGTDRPASNDLETMQLEVRLRALRPDARAPSASQLALSVRCALRNKFSGS